MTHSERAGNGDQLVYCEAHAYWRSKTIRLPLVRAMRAGEQPDPKHVVPPQIQPFALAEAVVA